MVQKTFCACPENFFGSPVNIFGALCVCRLYSLRVLSEIAFPYRSFCDFAGLRVYCRVFPCITGISLYHGYIVGCIVGYFPISRVYCRVYCRVFPYITGILSGVLSGMSLYLREYSRVFPYISGRILGYFPISPGVSVYHGYILGCFRVYLRVYITGVFLGISPASPYRSLSVIFARLLCIYCLYSVCLSVYLLSVYQPIKSLYFGIFYIPTNQISLFGIFYIPTNHLCYVFDGVPWRSSTLVQNYVQNCLRK